MSDRVDDVLKKLGFNDKEARVYLSLLDLNEASASDIADHTSITRPLIYEITSRLEANGHITRFEEENTTRFRPRPPEHLLRQAEEKQRRVENALPSLERRYDESIDDFRADVSRGKQSIREALSHIVNNADAVDVLGETNKFADVVPVAIQSYLDDLRDADIEERVLKPTSAEAVNHTAVTTRFVDVPLPRTTTVIYPPHVTTFIWSKPYGVIHVASDDTARSYQAYFQALWEQARHS